MATNEKLDRVIEDVQRRWGSKALRRLTTADRQHPIPRLSSSLANLDVILGGGLPQGRITELVGQPTSGILTLTCRFVASAQDNGYFAVYVDLSHTFDPDYAARCGANLDRLFLVRPSTLPDALDILHALISGGMNGVFVLDRFDDVSRATEVTLRRLTAALEHTPTLFLLLTSLGAHRHGATDAFSPFVVTRLILQRQMWLVDQGRVAGYTARLTVSKNRYGPVGQSIIVRITLGDAVKVSCP